MPDYDLGTARGKIEIDSSGAVKGVATAEGAVHGLGRSSTSTSTALMATGGALTGVGVAAIAGFGLAVNAAANFEQGLSKIEAVSGATEAQMEAISKKALQLGADTAFSAGEAASAMEELVKAGLSVDDVLNGAADATVALAAAGEVDLTQAAEIASAAMNNFNLSAQDMPKVADLIAGAANASAISVSDFGLSMKQAGASAALVGLEFDDMSLAITAMGNAGIKGSDAGTSLKTMLMNLQPTTEKQINLMTDLGIISSDTTKATQVLADLGFRPLSGSIEHVRQAASDYLEATQGIPDDTMEMGRAVDTFLQSNADMGNAFFDSTGKIKSMAEISNVLGGALEGMTDQQKSMALEVMFGSDAIRAAAIIAKEGGEGFNELAVQMGKVNATEVAATKMDNLKGSLEQLSGSFETLLIVVGTPFLGMVRKVVDGLTQMINGFTNLPEGMQRTISMVALAVGALIGLVGVFLLVGGTIMKVKAIVQGLQLMSLLGNPVFLVIAAVAALVAGLVLLYQRSETVRNIIDAIGQTLMGILGPAIDAVVGWVQNFMAQMQNAWGVIQSGDDVLGGLAEIFDNIFGNTGALIRPVISFVDYLTNTWKKVVSFTRDIWPQVSEAIEHVMNVIHDIIGVVLDIVMALWRSWGDDIWRIVKAVFEVIKETVENAIKLVQNIIRLALAVINGDWGKAWQAIKNIVSTVWNQIWTLIDGAISIIRSVLAGGISILKEMWSNVWNWFYDTIVRRIADIIVSVTAIPGKIVAALSGLGAQMLQIGKDMIMGMVNGIKSMVGNLIDAAKNVVGSAVDGVKGFLGIGSPSKLFFEFGVNTIEGFINGVRDEEGNLTRTMEDLFSAAVQGVNSILGGIGDLSGNHQAHIDVTRAEKELEELRQRQSALPEDIANAEARLRRARQRASQVTLEEEAAILDAKENLRRANENAAAVQGDITATTDDYRRAVIAVQLAEQELARVQKEATSPASDQVAALTERLSGLRREQAGITDALRLAQDNLNAARERAIISEARLVQTGQDLIALGPESEEMFRQLARRAGYTAGEIDGLVSQYLNLAQAIRDATKAAQEAAWYAAVSRNAAPKSGTAATTVSAKSLSAAANNNTTYINATVSIPAKDVKEMQDVAEFFDTIKQVSRAGG